MSAPQKLDPVFKAKWLEALRSGKFEQGDSYLCYRGAYCCLGVAQNISGFPHALGGNGKDEELPPAEQLEAWGLTYGQANHLAELNDGSNDVAQHSFAQIADFIEREL